MSEPHEETESPFESDLADVRLAIEKIGLQPTNAKATDAAAYLAWAEDSLMDAIEGDA